MTTRPASQAFEAELEALIQLDGKTPILALRASFMMGARVALGLPTKQRLEAIKWLDEQIRVCVHEVGSYGRR